MTSALSILGLVRRCGPGTNAAQIAGELGVPASTTYRLLGVLVDEGYLNRLPAGHGFSLGPRTTQLAEHPAMALTTAARAELATLRARVGVAVHLGAFESGRVRLVDIAAGQPTTDPLVLTRHPHASALGQLMLAYAPSWRDLVPGHRLARLTEATIVLPDELEAELALIRRRGFAMQRDQLSPGTAGLAVPVRDDRGDVLGGLVASAADGVLPGRAVDLAGALRDCAERLGPLVA